MAISIKAIGSKLKSIETDVEAGLKKVATFTEHVAGDANLQAVVESVTTVALGTSAANLEKVAFQVVNELASAFTTGEAAVVAGLKNAGLDDATITAFKNVALSIAKIKL